MIFPDPADIVNGEEVTNPSTGVIYVYDEASNSWNIKMQDVVDTSEYATIAYSDSEDAKLKKLIEDNTTQIEEWANSISSGSYEWHATATEAGQIASIPSTQGNWSVVTKIAFDPTPIGIGAVSVANMSIGDIVTFTSPSDDDYANFEISDTDSVASTIDVTLVDSEGGPAYGSTVMVKHYPQIDTSNFVTNVEFTNAVTGLQDQIDALPEPGADADHNHPDYSLTTHTHPYSPVDHNHGGDYSEIDHDHDDIKSGLEDLNKSVAELNKSKPFVFKYKETLPLQDHDFTIIGEDGLSVYYFADAKSIIWNQSNPDVAEFIKAGQEQQTIKISEVGDAESWMIAELEYIDSVSNDWTINSWYHNGTPTGEAEYVFELLPPSMDTTHDHEELQAQVDHNEDRIVAIETELQALADTKEAGEWVLVSVLDFDVRGSGEMTLTTDNFAAPANTISLHSTDSQGVSHGFSRVEVGDYVEIVEEHDTRVVGDYGLYTVTGKNGNDFSLALEQGMGTATAGSHFIVKFFHLNDNLDLADLDARYASTSHTHSVGAHYHNYEQIAIRHQQKTYYGSNINWDNPMYFFPFERRGSSGSLYQGGRIENMGKLLIKQSNLYAQVGKSGTLIGTTGESSANHGTFIVMNVWDSTYQSSHSTGTRLETIYGTTIWVQDSAKGRTWESSDALWWWYRGAGR